MGGITIQPPFSFGGDSGGGGGGGVDYAQAAENARIQAANAAAMQQLQSQWAESDKMAQANAAQTAKNDAARLEAEKQAKIQAENDIAARAQDAAGKSASATLAGLNLTQQAADAAKKQQMQSAGGLPTVGAGEDTSTPLAASAGLYGGVGKTVIPGTSDTTQAPLTNQFSLPMAQGLKFGGA